MLFYLLSCSHYLEVHFTYMGLNNLYLLLLGPDRVWVGPGLHVVLLHPRLLVDDEVGHVQLVPALPPRGAGHQVIIRSRVPAQYNRLGGSVQRDTARKELRRRRCAKRTVQKKVLHKKDCAEGDAQKVRKTKIFYSYA